MKNKIWAFIDLENTGSLKEVDFSRYNRVYIFCGAKQDHILINSIPTSRFTEVRIFKANEISKDNVDFHICFYLGKSDSDESIETQFVVISNDKGYDNILEHITACGRKCSRIPSNSNINDGLNKKIQSVINEILGKEKQALPKTEQALKNYIKSRLGEYKSQNNVNHTYNRLIKNELISSRLNEKNKVSV